MSRHKIWKLAPGIATYEVVTKRQLMINMGVLTKFKALSVGEEGKQIAIVPLDSSNQKNAQLIEAAPELLNLLKDIRDIIDTSEEWWMDCPEEFDTERIDDLIDRCRK